MAARTSKLFVIAPFTHAFHLAGYPLQCFVALRVIKVLNAARSEWLAKNGHSVFPSRVADQRDAFDIREVFEGQLRIFPASADRPAVEVRHLEQDTNFTVACNPLLQFRYEYLVVFLRQLA